MLCCTVPLSVKVKCNLMQLYCVFTSWPFYNSPKVSLQSRRMTKIALPKKQTGICVVRCRQRCKSDKKTFFVSFSFSFILLFIFFSNACILVCSSSFSLGKIQRRRHATRRVVFSNLCTSSTFTVLVASATVKWFYDTQSFRFPSFLIWKEIVLCVNPICWFEAVSTFLHLVSA